MGAHIVYFNVSGSSFTLSARLTALLKLTNSRKKWYKVRKIQTETCQDWLHNWFCFIHWVGLCSWLLLPFHMESNALLMTFGIQPKKFKWLMLVGSFEHNLHQWMLRKFKLDSNYNILSCEMASKIKIQMLQILNLNQISH